MLILGSNRNLPTIGSFLVLGLVSSAFAATVSSTPAQTFLGIGGSGAWWPMDVFKFPEASRQQLSNLLFSQDGLGLSSYRWNIGAGGVNVSNPTRAPETFYVSQGVYNWSADAQGVYFMQEANKRGVEITAFANSAPAPLTSGRASCNGGFVTAILIADLSNRRAEVVNGLWNALSARGLAQQVGIIADESSQLSQATGEYGSWLSQVIDKVAALAHHTYDFPSDATYQSYVTNTARLFPGKKTWMTEVCCSMGQADGTGRGWSQGYDPTIAGALMFSGMVFQSLVTVNETHYDFWTHVSNGLGCNPLTAGCATTPNNQGWNDGVIYYDSNYARNGNFQFYITKHFWAYKHFGNFVKPGMQRLPVTNLSSSENALKSYILVASSSSQFNVIVMNPFASTNTVALTLPSRACAASAFRTSASQDFVSVGLPTSSSSGAWSLQLPAMSLTTFVFTKGC